jgi:hypothetical protein
MIHKDSIVQLTHDVQLRRGVLVPRGTSGRVLSKSTLHRSSMIEFTVGRQTIIARVDDHDLVQVRPNARV